jgi:hypothetical protein
MDQISHSQAYVRNYNLTRCLITSYYDLTQLMLCTLLLSRLLEKAGYYHWKYPTMLPYRHMYQYCIRVAVYTSSSQPAS